MLTPEELTLSDIIMRSLDNIYSWVWGLPLLCLLIGIGLYLTIRLKGLQFRYLIYALKIAFGKQKKTDGKGDISHFESLMTALAATIGIGNIAGVATAIAIGGLGAVFWMWVTALLGMSSAFVEATLAQIFKVKNGDGTYRGGPAYYIQQGLGSRGWGIAFAISLLFAFGLVFNALQSNAIAESMNVAFGVDRTLMGVLVVAASGAVIFGGARRIGKVAEILVPIMAIA